MDEPLTHVDHPDLHHYTGWDGLEGIFTSGVLRAKGYRFLNDYSEIRHYQSDLQAGVCERLKGYIHNRNKVDREFKARTFEVYKTVAIAAERIGENIVSALYKVTFEGSDGPPFSRPFITSFCSHSGDQPYERQHGLLSQWRGYGVGDRYALVFDTKQLEGLLSKESKVYQYDMWNFYDVVYSGYMSNYQSWYDEFSDYLFEATVRMFDEDAPQLEDLYVDFVNRAARLKHEGFQEEREVRIVAIPHTIELDQHLKSEQPDTYEPPKKKFKSIIKNNADGSEYIELFDFNQGRKLPINRIIVGPHPKKEENAKKARALIGPRIRIDVSETPYVG